MKAPKEAYSVWTMLMLWVYIVCTGRYQGKDPKFRHNLEETRVYVKKYIKLGTDANQTQGTRLSGDSNPSVSTTALALLFQMASTWNKKMSLVNLTDHFLIAQY